MKVLVAVLAILSVVAGLPTPQNTISYMFENGTVITEDLDEPVAATYAADIKKQRFIFFNQANKDTGCELAVGDAASLKSCGFDASLPTRFAVHGWQCDYTAESVQDLKNAYLAKGKYNVIICDYKAYNSPYLTAVGNAKSLGDNVGTFIEGCIKNGMSKTNFAILGHSLGAHVSGYAGQYLKSKGITVPKIVGLDAAGPMFNGQDASKRLSSDDAAVVQCVHTSTALGMTNPCGTVDFYPNGGSNQPTCQHAAMTGGCDHAASHRYYAASIADDKAYPSHSCGTVAEAQATEKALSVCKAGNVYMGEPALNSSPTGIYYVSV